MRNDIKKNLALGTLKTVERYCRLKSGTAEIGASKISKQENGWAKGGKLIEIVRKGR